MICEVIYHGLQRACYGGVWGVCVIVMEPSVQPCGEGVVAEESNHEVVSLRVYRGLWWGDEAATVIIAVG